MIKNSRKLLNVAKILPKLIILFLNNSIFFFRLNLRYVNKTPKYFLKFRAVSNIFSNNFFGNFLSQFETSYKRFLGSDGITGKGPFKNHVDSDGRGS